MPKPTPPLRTFKIPESKAARPRMVRGRLVAECVRSHHVVQVIHTEPEHTFVTVISDSVDGWLITDDAPDQAALREWLYDLAIAPECPVVKALATKRPDNIKTRKDLLEAVDVVLRILAIA